MPCVTGLSTGGTKGAGPDAASMIVSLAPGATLRAVGADQGGAGDGGPACVVEACRAATWAFACPIGPGYACLAVGAARMRRGRRPVRALLSSHAAAGARHAQVQRLTG